MIKQSHCILADDFRDLFVLAQTISFLQSNHIALPTSPNVAILTISGGAGAVMSDWCTKLNVQIPLLSEQSFQGLTELYPAWMPPNRFALVDFWPAIEKAAGDFEKTAYKALDYLLKDPAVACIFFTAFYSEKDWPINWDHISTLILQSSKLFFI